MCLLLCSRPFLLKIMIISLFSLRAFCHYHVMPVFLQYILQQDYKAIGGMDNDKKVEMKGQTRIGPQRFWPGTAGCSVMLFDQKCLQITETASCWNSTG